MYRHKIIEDTARWASGIRRKGPGLAADTLEMVTDLLRQSVELFVGDYAGFAASQRKTRELFQRPELAGIDLPVPGDTLLLTYRMTLTDKERREMLAAGNVEAPRRAVLLHRRRDLTMGFSFCQLEKEKTWVPGPVMWALGADGREIWEPFVGDMPDGMVRDAAGDLMFELGVLLFVLHVAQSDDIRVDFVPPEEKLNRKRRKRGGELDAGHYVFMRVTDDGRVVRLTHVNGHFADYRHGNGLFGKHKIIVWVPDSIRAT